jgi:hypothetical protein
MQSLVSEVGIIKVFRSDCTEMVDSTVFETATSMHNSATALPSQKRLHPQVFSLPIFMSCIHLIGCTQFLIMHHSNLPRAGLAFTKLQHFTSPALSVAIVFGRPASLGLA